MKENKLKIVLATRNKHKMDEIKNICKDLPVKWLSLDDIGFTDEIKEDGLTFEENAIKKADSIFQKVKLPVVADDSGLEVDALNGAPGIYSSRFSGANANTESNNRLLLEKLKSVPLEKRTARFVCVAAFIDGHERKTFRGTVEGKIIDQPRGTEGFGYDPLFQPEGYTQTFAELGESVKNSISHRANAFEQLKQFLVEYYFSNHGE